MGEAELKLVPPVELTLADRTFINAMTFLVLAQHDLGVAEMQKAVRELLPKISRDIPRVQQLSEIAEVMLYPAAGMTVREKVLAYSGHRMRAQSVLAGLYVMRATNGLDALQKGGEL